MIKTKLIFLLLILSLINPVCFAKNSIRVAFINPDSKGSAYWDLVTQFMQHSAKNLGIKLNVVYANKNRYLIPELAEELALSDEKPDYLIYIFGKNQTPKILKLTEKHAIKSFLFNTGISDNVQQDIGMPREKFSHWIGHMTPKTADNNKTLTHELIQQARNKNLYANDGRIHILGLTMHDNSAVATEWNRGLQEAISHYDDVELRQLIHSNWDGKLAAHKVKGLLKRYPDAAILTILGEISTLQSIKAAEEFGRLPGGNLLIGGSGLGLGGMQAIQEGKLLGGVSGSAWAGAKIMVYLYDYHHGIDFISEGKSIRYSAELVNKNTAANFISLRDKNNWQKIDFRLFSKVLNPSIKKYDFSPSALFHAVNIVNKQIPSRLTK